MTTSEKTKLGGGGGGGGVEHPLGETLLVYAAYVYVCPFCIHVHACETIMKL